MRVFAERVFGADTLEEKLFEPQEGFSSLYDDDPGEACAWVLPGRPSYLQVAPKKERKKMPKPNSLHDPEMRVRCLHTFANHELMALELMAWALLAYPDAPSAFRRGLVWLIEEEQRHLSMYMDRLAGFGVRFGDIPVNDHFWRIAPSLSTPLKWVCAMNLTFEQANLDHARDFMGYFRAVEDEASALLMERIHADEVRHVGFGGRWLERFAPSGRDLFEVYAEHLTDLNTPNRGRGVRFDAEARRRANLPESFIAKMEAS